MTEQILNTEPVAKPDLDEDDKTVIGQKLGAIIRRYPNSRLLREAQIPLTVKVYESLSKRSAWGNILELEGIVENIDFTQKRVVLEGRRIRLSEIIEVTIPARFEDTEDDGEDYFPDESVDSFPDFRMNPDPWMRDSREAQAAYHADPDSGYFPDPDFEEYDDSDMGYYPDTFPDYDAQPITQKKETAVKRKPKTILYTPKTGYRPNRR